MKFLNVVVVVALFGVGGVGSFAAPENTGVVNPETGTAHSPEASKEKAADSKVIISQKDKLQKYVNACMPAQGISNSASKIR